MTMNHEVCLAQAEEEDEDQIARRGEQCDGEEDEGEVEGQAGLTGDA